MRQALQQSLNMPAIAVLDRVGRQPADGAALRRRAPCWCCRRGQSPGLAIGLGGVGTKLSDLVMLYAGIAAARHGAAVARTPGRAGRRKRGG